MAKNAVIGPWGGEGGVRWSYVPKGKISKISLTYDDVIHSIVFTGEDENGNLDQSKTFGSSEGSKQGTADIDIKTEKLNGISGTYDSSKGVPIITSLSFTTDKGTLHGPFGPENGTAFSLQVKDDSLVGFHGHCGWLLDGIGVYLRSEASNNTAVVRRWGSMADGQEWTYEPKGLISNISFTYDKNIYSISFSSTDENGNVDGPKKFGWTDGPEKAQFDIDVKSEKLNNISGTYGVSNGWMVITSLSFSTDKNRSFGPFGVANGSAFSLPIKDGYISGFHGRSGIYLDGLGVYVKTA